MSPRGKVVSVTAAPEFDETYAWKMGGRVRIQLTDGRLLERTVQGQRGSMHAPLSEEQLARKFRMLVTDRVGDVDHLVQTILGLGFADTVTSLTAALR